MEYKRLDKNQHTHVADDLNIRIKLVENDNWEINEKLIQSTTDTLTGLYSHRMLFEILKECTNESEQNEKSFSIIMFDVDNFKRINESKGHLYGDKVLIEFASIIRKHMKASDVAGRYGGEEFMIILSDVTLNEVITVAESIRKAVEERYKAEGIQITVSGGIEQFNKKDRLSEIMLSLDIKLYAAKRHGKNRIIY